MSKKIAQLTKVIFHLNTKNEDHQAETDAVASYHQMEIEQILRDASQKLGKFKEALESKQSSVFLLLKNTSFVFKMVNTFYNLKQGESGGSDDKVTKKT